MAGGMRDLLTLVLRWWSHWTPPPIAGPYRVARGAVYYPGAAAADLSLAGIAAGQAHEF